MNAFLLIVPLFLIRFGLLGIMNQEALRSAAHFAPLEGGEKTAFWFYELSNAVLILYPLTLKVQAGKPGFFTGLAVYLLGVAVLAVSTVQFARPGQDGLNTGGIYRVSRNPMYVGYFIYFLGCVILTRSLPLLLSLLVFQISAHWIIRSEERWCKEKFGDAYLNYMKRVRRYL